MTSRSEPRRVSIQKGPPHHSPRPLPNFAPPLAPPLAAIRPAQPSCRLRSPLLTPASGTGSCLAASSPRRDYTACLAAQLRRQCALVWQGRGSCRAALARAALAASRRAGPAGGDEGRLAGQPSTAAAAANSPYTNSCSHPRLQRRRAQRRCVGTAAQHLRNSCSSASAPRQQQPQELCRRISCHTAAQQLPHSGPTAATFDPQAPYTRGTAAGARR